MPSRTILGYPPNGGQTSVTFVLCAAFPVQRFVLLGQHRATVQKCLEYKVPSLMRYFCRSGMYCKDCICQSWSSVKINRILGCFWATAWRLVNQTRPAKSIGSNIINDDPLRKDYRKRGEESTEITAGIVEYFIRQ